MILTVLIPLKVHAEGQTTMVSVSSTGVLGNGNCYSPTISSDGRYVAFESESANLVANDNNNSNDIFVHDRQTGQTTVVSVSSTGVLGNLSSSRPSISADGRYVVFDSGSNNLVTGDSNNASDIFVHDRYTGLTSMVSVSSSGEKGNDLSSEASISSDGRYVAFESFSDNFVKRDSFFSLDIFVHDRQTGLTSIVSVSSSGELGNGPSFYPSVSSDGRYVAFYSLADNLVSGDTNHSRDIFVHDRQTGQTTVVSVSSTGVLGNGNCYSPTISSDGRYVAFESKANNLVPGDTNGKYDIFVHDRLTAQTRRVSVSSMGVQGNDESWSAFISYDGRYVAFDSIADNLVLGDINYAGDAFLHDRQTGQTTMVSVSSSGLQGNSDSFGPLISSDGRTLAFVSIANNLVPGDTNEKWDIFVNELRQPKSCDGDFDFDRDVDGDDLAVQANIYIRVANGGDGVSLEDFAGYFGRNDCPI
jgi:Tol biopolymer transport system component